MDPLSEPEFLRLFGPLEETPLLENNSDPLSLEKQPKTTLFDRVFELFGRAFGLEKKSEAALPRKALPINKEKILSQVQYIITSLETNRNSLIDEFGKGAEPFVRKVLEPEIQNGMKLIERLEKPKLEEPNPVLDVGLIIRYAHPNKIGELLTKTVHNSIREAVSRDLATLLGSQSSALELVSDEAIQKELVSGFEVKLLPIFDRLEELSENVPDVTTIRDLFLWEQDVITSRNVLTERGLLLIDALLRLHGVDVKELSDEELPRPDAKLQEILEAYQRLDVAFSSKFSFEKESDILLFIIRQLREDVLDIDPHTLIQEDLKVLFDDILKAINKAENLIRPSGS